MFWSIWYWCCRNFKLCTTLSCHSILVDKIIPDIFCLWPSLAFNGKVPVLVNKVYNWCDLYEIHNWLTSFSPEEDVIRPSRLGPEAHIANNSEPITQILKKNNKIEIALALTVIFHCSHNFGQDGANEVKKCRARSRQKFCDIDSRHLRKHGQMYSSRIIVELTRLLTPFMLSTFTNTNCVNV